LTIAVVFISMAGVQHWFVHQQLLRTVKVLAAA
jgi:type IV secretory pathway VirB2 component (pilin)